jgi:glycine/D-amino acid oxidase-like deaminating enzyme/nitrite reductase/ring-hydroxylating ferredoxin subunit
MGSINEHHRSLWIATTPPGLNGVGGITPSETEICVVGAGIVGLTVARLLADAGREVTVLEAGRVSAGATGYTTAKITALHGAIYHELVAGHGVDRAASYANANQAAIELIASLVETDEIECEFERATAFTFASDESGLRKLEQELSAATQIGLPVQSEAVTELPFATAGAISLENQAQFHPRKYALGLVDAIQRLGGRVIEHTRVVNVDQTADGCEVVTETGTLRAQHVILATHLPLGTGGVFFARAHAYRSYLIAARVEDTLPKGMYISVDEPLRSLRSSGEFLLIGGEGHKVGQDPDTTDNYDVLEAWARERFDVRDVEYRWSAQDYISVDGMPYVGKLDPKNSRIHVATGFRKWGMTNGTAAAMILCDEILERENPWAEAFDSTRWKPLKSARKLVLENLDVVRRFIGDRLLPKRRPSVEDLRPGMGAIVDVDGDAVAAYRDPEGKLHAVSATCTHMGCKVAFNTAERTWDCPCHGSRFSTDGRVLEGPAVQDLAVRELTES